MKVFLNPTDVRLVLVVVDRPTNYVHFIALSHPYTASKVAAPYVQHILKLHGMPTSIISDRNPSFTSAFWSELMTLQSVQLAMFSAYLPQIDGQTEVVNKSLEHYLRSFEIDLRSGLSGSQCVNFGSIPIITQPQDSHPLRLCMELLHLDCLTMSLALPKLKLLILICNLRNKYYLC